MAWNWIQQIYGLKRNCSIYRITPTGLNSLCLLSGKIYKLETEDKVGAKAGSKREDIYSLIKFIICPECCLCEIIYQTDRFEVLDSYHQCECFHSTLKISVEKVKMENKQ